MNKTLKSDPMRQMVRGAGISLFLGFFAYGLMFLFKLLSARHYGAENYGLFEMTNTVLLIAMVFATFGIPAGIARYVPLYKYREDHSLLRGYLRFVFITTLSFSVAVSAVLFLGAHKIAVFLNFPEQFEHLLQIACLIIPVKTGSQVLRKILAAEKRIFLQSFSENFLEKFSLIAIVSASIALNAPLESLLWALLFSSVISLAFDTASFIRTERFQTTDHAKYENIGWILFSVPLVFTGIFSFFIQWSDNILVGKLIGAEILGIYAIAYSIADFIGALQVPFMAIFGPLIGEMLAKNRKDDIRNLFRGASSWLIMTGMLFFLLFLILGKELLTSLYGIGFASGYTPLLIISAGFIVYNLFGLNESVLMLHGKTGSILRINLFSATLNIVLNILTIPHFGMLGAAISSTISLNVKAILGYMIASRHHRLGIDSMHIGKVILAALTTGIIGIISKHVMTDSLISLTIVTIEVLTVYPVSLFLFGAIDKQNRDILSSALLRIKNVLGLNRFRQEGN